MSCPPDDDVLAWALLGVFVLGVFVGSLIVVGLYWYAGK